jgi:hypothetical protein
MRRAGSIFGWAWSIALAGVGCGTASIWPGAGDGAPAVRTACQPGPLAVEMLALDCAPMMPLVPASQSEKPCHADVDGRIFDFDAAGNLIAPNAFRYTYRTDGNVQEAIMDNASALMGIRFAYGDDAKLIRAELSGSTQGASAVDYDFADGKLLRERSTSGVHNEYLYDGERLLKIVSLSEASLLLPETAILFEYDGLGRRTAEQHIDRGTSTLRFEYTYDSPDSDRVIEMFQLDASSRKPRYESKTIKSYDGEGRLSTVATDANLDGVPDQIITLAYCSKS